MEATNAQREKKTYIATGIKMLTFSVPKIGPDGKIAYQTIPTTGQIRFINNDPVPVEELRRFETLPVDPKQKPVVFSCFYTLSPEDKNYDSVLAVLERMANDPSSGVLSQEEYDKKRNPAAFAEVEKRRKTEAEIEQHKKAAQEAAVKAETLKTENLQKDEKIRKFEDALSEKDRLLKEANEKMEALMKGETPKKPGRPRKDETAEGT